MKTLKILALMLVFALVACEDTTVSTRVVKVDSEDSRGAFTGKRSVYLNGVEIEEVEYLNGWVVKEVYLNTDNGIDSIVFTYNYSESTEGFVVDKTKVKYFSDGRVE